MSKRIGGFFLLCLALVLNLGWSPSARAAPFEDSLAQRTLACTACHGLQGQAGPDGYYPRLAGKPADYLYNQLLNIRSGRRHYPLMTGLLDTLDDAYLRAIAGYFSALAVPYPPPAKASTAAGELERGRKLVQQGEPARGLPACSQCHGLQLTGVVPATPGLLGLPADYLNAQLGGWQSGQRHAAEPDCMARIAKQLKPGDSSAIARWLAAQMVPAQPQAAERKPAPTATTVDLRCGSDTPATGAGDATAGDGSASASASTRPAEGGTSTAPTPIARGAYLARLGNCALCHSARGAMAYGGGRAIATPFGSVFSSNLTPDAEHGIGRWSADDFWRALHHGISRDGRALYPAFPYTSYTLLTRADSDALFAFLKTVPASAQANRAHGLRWPFNTQLALKAWRSLFFSAADDEPVAAPASLAAAQGPAWQRGRYLVEGLGHCLECHGARNFLGARSGTDGRGGYVPAGDPWFAPSLHDAGGASVAAWSVADISAFLQTGRSQAGVASGPMAEVVFNGTQYLSDADAQAMAVYLKSLPQTASGPAPRMERAASVALQSGARLYQTHCADCHGAQGQGRPGVYPALAGNRTVTQTPANNLINSVLRGGFGAATAGHARPYGMPPFMLRLSDTELAALLSYLRSSWGNQASALGEFDINKFRRTQAP